MAENKKGNKKRTKKAVFLDTNIFLRVIVKEDEKSFRECTELLTLVKSGERRAYTSTLVLAEVNWVLNSFYKFPKSEVVLALSGILSLKNLTIDDKYDTLTAISLYERHSVKFIDALLSTHHLVFRKEVPMVSYDKDFSALPVNWLRPEEVLRK